MEETKLKQLRERVLGNKRLAEIVKKYLFVVGTRRRGQFLSLIEESYNIGFEDAKGDKSE